MYKYSRHECCTAITADIDDAVNVADTANIAETADVEDKTTESS